MKKRRKIKHLGRRKLRFDKKLNKYILRNIIITVIIVGGIIGSVELTQYIKGIYSKVTVENSEVGFYIDIADEVSEGKAQVNWQQLMAIDLVRYDEDLSNIRKKDLINLGEMFIVKNKDRDDINEYEIRELDEVLNKLGFSKKDKEEVYEKIEGLKYVALSKGVLGENSENTKFINEISSSAIENYKKYGIYPSITVAQAILESGWGKSELSKVSNNLFGIKADSRWSGAVVSMDTKENYNDEIVANFRSYPSKSESIKDHAEFLVNNKRYTEHGVFEANHYTEQAQALENAGYSTVQDAKGEKIYAEKLIDIIKKYNLQLLDNEAQLLK